MHTPPIKFDVIIIGSGPGGASVAQELAGHGHKTLILEWGDNKPLTGTFANMAKIAGIPGRGLFVQRDASLLLRGITSGGSSTVNYASAMLPPVELFSAHGIDLSQEVKELLPQVPFAPLPDELIGPMAKRIMKSAQSLGYDWQKLDKMIYADKCRSHCWRCTYGCPYAAKWNARMFLDEALSHHSTLVTGAKVGRILIHQQRVVGVEYKHNGTLQQVFADKVVLAAGGISTPQILTASGVKNAGKDFFVDPVVAVMGSVNGLKGGREVPMSAGMRLADAGVMLADMTLPKPLFQAFAAQVGRFDRLFSHSSTLTIMVKAKDQLSGRVGRYWPDKTLSVDDKDKLRYGTEIAKNILADAGAHAIFKSWHFAAHPGGSAKIGEVVNADLQTEINGLYVCDASVIPAAWGLPPSFTLLCLGKRLGKHLTGLRSLLEQERVPDSSQVN